MGCTAWLSVNSFNLQAAVLTCKTAVDDCAVVKILYYGMHESPAAVLREASRTTWAMHALHMCKHSLEVNLHTREEMIRALIMASSHWQWTHQVCKLSVTPKRIKLFTAPQFITRRLSIYIHLQKSMHGNSLYGNRLIAFCTLFREAEHPSTLQISVLTLIA